MLFKIDELRCFFYVGAKKNRQKHKTNSAMSGMWHISNKIVLSRSHILFLYDVMWQYNIYSVFLFGNKTVTT